MSTSVQAAFKKVLESARLSDDEKRLLRVLYDQWNPAHPKGLSQFDLATVRKAHPSGRVPEGSEKRARTAIYGLGQKLKAYYGDDPLDPLRFQISHDAGLGGFFLEVQPRLVIPIEGNTRLLFKSRPHPENWLRKIVCSPSKDVLFVSICSVHTFQRIKPWFKDGDVKAKHFRVLTLLPPAANVIPALAKHLHEEKEFLISNIQTAWREWKKLEDKYKYVEVYGYTSSPTAQALCNDEYVKVELLPFNGLHELGTPDNRPALVMRASDQKQKVSYQFFKQWFEDLWVSAMRNTPDRLVHKRWLKERANRLAALGLATRRSG